MVEDKREPVELTTKKHFSNKKLLRKTCISACGVLSLQYSDFYGFSLSDL
jgi:hypothetical protein